MKLQLKEQPKHEEGDTRMKKGFLFLPKKINKEWRWLEKALWREELEKVICYGAPSGKGPPCIYKLRWCGKRWINKKRSTFFYELY